MNSQVISKMLRSNILVYTGLMLGTLLGAEPAWAQLWSLDVTAHRGDSAHYHENSMAAFESAARKGASSIEFDVILTRDGKPVVYHGFKLNPKHFKDLAGATELDIRKLTFAQVRRLEYADCEGNCRVLTLEEFFTFAQTAPEQMRLHLELKHDAADIYSPEDFARIVGAEIAKSEVASRVTVRSFDHEVVAAFKSSMPQMPRTLLVGRQWRTSYWAMRYADPKKIIERYGPTTIAPHHTMVDRNFVDKWAAAGVGVNPYTVNDLKVAEVMIRAGVTGITTDDPAGLKTMIREKKLLFQPRGRDEILDGLERASSDITSAPYRKLMQEQVLPFVRRHLELDYLRTASGSVVNVAKFSASHDAKGAIVFAPGKGNSWVEFLEGIKFFVELGFSVYAFDLPGQGLSARLSADRNRVHLADSKRYQRDLADVIENVVPQRFRSGGNLHYLGFSTSAPVGFEYAVLHPETFKSMIFVAPYFALQNSRRLQIARAVIGLVTPHSWALPFQNDPRFDAVTDQKLQAERGNPRRQWRFAVAKNLPDVINYSVTEGWFDSTRQMNDRVRELAPQIRTPFLILQSEMDDVVDAEAQRNIVELSNGMGKIEVLLGSQHQVQQARTRVLMQAGQLMGNHLGLSGATCDSAFSPIR